MANDEDIRKKFDGLISDASLDDLHLVTRLLLVDYDAVRWGTPAMDILYSLSNPEGPGPWKVGRVAASLAREALFE